MCKRSIDLGYATMCHFPLIFSPGTFLVVPEPTGRLIDASEQYLSPSFLTQKYRFQLNPHMLRSYNNLSVVLTCQERALESSLDSNPSTLSPSTIACYDSLRFPTLYHILIFLCGYDANEISHANDINQESATLSPIQSICRVTIPIVALQDQFLPYRRSIFTTALTGRLYNTLSEEIDREACWAMYAEVMVWALMFGIYIAHGHSPEKELWFTQELIDGVRGRKGQRGQLGGGWQWGWETVKPLLKRFYWCERFFGEEFKVSFIHPLILAFSKS